MNSAKNQTKSFSIMLVSFYTITIIVFLYFLITGWEYYTTSLVERVRHPDYKLLKPGGLQSHGLGIIGSLMMLLLLLYSFRKRFSFMNRFGNISNWLHIHIFLGINGPLFVILHSTFKLNGLISVSFWAMIIVAVSGILGRYLYIKIPRNIHGQELSLKEVEQQSLNLNNELKEQFELYKSNPESIMSLLQGITVQNLTLLKLLWLDFLYPIKSIKLKNRLVKEFNIPKDKASLVVSLANQKLALERRITLWNKIHNLFHYWHVFHKPFAVIMYLIMIVHISISIWLGYNWIF